MEASSWTRPPAPPSLLPRLPSRGRQAPGSFSDRVPVLAWLIAVAFVAVELAVSGRYGFMQDELYFVEASRHLAFGYVDQPPLTPLLTRVAELPGLSPTAIRIIPALAGGAVVVAGVPRRLTAAALLPAVMGTIMDHPCLLPFRRAVIGVMGRNPRVRNRTGGCGGRLGVHDPGASIRDLPRVDDCPGRFTVGASGLRFHGGRGAP